MFYKLYRFVHIVHVIVKCCTMFMFNRLFMLHMSNSFEHVEHCSSYPQECTFF